MSTTTIAHAPSPVAVAARIMTMEGIPEMCDRWQLPTTPRYRVVTPRLSQRREGPTNELAGHYDQQIVFLDHVAWDAAGPGLLYRSLHGWAHLSPVSWYAALRTALAEARRDRQHKEIARYQQWLSISQEAHFPFIPPADHLVWFDARLAKRPSYANFATHPWITEVRG